MAPSKQAWKWVIGVAAVLYLALLPRFYVGFYNDDSVYVLAAQSLLQGHYAAINLPFHPPITFVPPGFPLLLAPFVALVAPHWAYLKVVPLGLTLLSGVFFWLLLKEWVDPFPRLVLLFLYMMNPLTAYFAGFVMSESAFLLNILMLFWLLSKSLRRKKSSDAWFLGVLLGWSLLLRADAIVLLPSVALGFVYLKRWKELILSMSVALFLWGIYLARNAFLPETGNTYLQVWLQALPYLSGQADGYRQLAAHGLRALSTLFTQNILGLYVDAPAIPSFWDRSFMVLEMGLMGVGLFALAKRAKRSKPWEAFLFSAAAFCFFHTLLHVEWPSIEARYFMPIVPFCLVFLVEGIRQCGRTIKRPSFWWGGVFLISVLYLRQDVGACYFIDVKHLRMRFPQETFSWISASTPPESCVFTSEPTVLTLYTKRFSIQSLPAKDAEEFRYRAMEKQVHYILLQPAHLVPYSFQLSDPNRIWNQYSRWVRSRPDVYVPVYTNPLEERDLFQVTYDDHFYEAYTLYLSAREDFEHASWDAGFSKLNEALQKYPSLVSALNGYGVGSLLSGQHIPEGTRRLERAARLEPENPWVLLNLARIYKRRPVRP